MLDLGISQGSECLYVLGGAVLQTLLISSHPLQTLRLWKLVTYVCFTQHRKDTGYSVSIATPSSDKCPDIVPWMGLRRVVSAQLSLKTTVEL